MPFHILYSHTIHSIYMLEIATFVTQIINLFEHVRCERRQHKLVPLSPKLTIFKTSHYHRSTGATVLVTDIQIETPEPVYFFCSFHCIDFFFVHCWPQSPPFTNLEVCSITQVILQLAGLTRDLTPIWQQTLVQVHTYHAITLRVISFVLIIITS